MPTISIDELNEVLKNALKYHDEGNLEKAEKLYKYLLGHKSDNIDLLFNLGVVLKQQNKIENAFVIFTKLNNLVNDFQIKENLAELSIDLKKYQLALKIYKELIFNNYFSAKIYYNLALSFYNINDLDNASLYYQKSIDVDNKYYDSYINLSYIFFENKEFVKSMEIIDLAIENCQNIALLYKTKAIILQKLNKYIESKEFYNKAINLGLKDKEIYNNLAILYNKLHNYTDSIKIYEILIKQDPYNIEYIEQLAFAYFNIGAIGNSKKYFSKLLQLDENNNLAKVYLLHENQHLCDWDEFDNLKKEIFQIKNINSLSSASTAFIFVSITEDINRCYEVARYGSLKLEENIEKISFNYNKIANKKLNIAYISNDFHDHATMHLMKDIFKYHDYSKYNISLFSYDNKENDDYRKFLNNIISNDIDISNISDLDAAKLINKNNINILIDLKCYTASSRNSILAYKSAPVQVNYLGFPGTSGAKYMDYIIADKNLIPEGHQNYYSEKIVYMPDCYQPNYEFDKDLIFNIKKSDFGIEEDKILLCSFNQPMKITKEIYLIWLSILKENQNTILWLYNINKTASNNLYKIANDYGLDINKRIFFMPNVSREEHLKRLSIVDLALDTKIYGGHTTTSDAIRVGVPVVTIKGNHFASRVCSSILYTSNLDSLVVNSLQEYHDIIKRMIKDKSSLIKIKQNLLKFNNHSPLFNSKSYVLSLELAFEKMWKNYIDGKSENIRI